MLSIKSHQRLHTLEVRVGNLLLGAAHPIRIQTMTTTDTMDTEATVAQTIRCIEAGAELVRITAPSKKEAENLAAIKKAVRAAGYDTPLVADIHFTPNAAEIAARIVEKVRVNPGNYVDKKKFDFINYNDEEYHAEMDRIRERFRPLVRICKEYGTALRIGTNHGSLSDRIMSRYGDTPLGMVESAMEFLRIARDESFHQIVLSMKSSNPQVMVQAYRLLVHQMHTEFGVCYPLHLGVTEAGDGEDGRIKSAMGIGTLLEEGIGDTIRVSLTEDPEYELPVCKDICSRYSETTSSLEEMPDEVRQATMHGYKRRICSLIGNIGGTRPPVVIADFSETNPIGPETLKAIGYSYDAPSDKWHIADAAADYVFIGKQILNFPLPGMLQALVEADTWQQSKKAERHYPLFEANQFLNATNKHPEINFVQIDTAEPNAIEMALRVSQNPRVVLCVYSSSAPALLQLRHFCRRMAQTSSKAPMILCNRSFRSSVDRQLIDFSTETGALFLDGFGDGLWLKNNPALLLNERATGRTYLPVNSNHQFLNNTAFSILQASRTRISKTEYISCPSCGRTLFDLQETTSRIRSATSHLKGVKIAIMGCIVNGPGEMADADFGYVGSGPGKITLYRGKEVVRKNVSSEVAVDALIALLKEDGVWVEPTLQTAAV
ncbi:MAG: (E)-4-hydroxy-3-methylbut-2-enyl-diphosphate synthase [Bacteroidetes bacterium]|nr:(E)-4-hydroxy-3-methylbut-2-enyl-diphosphate synthase [Bacteroidota bacterium]MBS1628947.1 (E)-4-hydroxy-3-methylbut-2-enyl-diphosphate synthase [Bacteroidota bacterium]